MNKLLMGAVAAFVLFASLSFYTTYNRFAYLDERVEEMRSDIGVQLARRASLIPNLVAVVAASAEFERGTYTEVAMARAGVERAQGELSSSLAKRDIEGANGADLNLEQSLGTFMRISVEAYPELQSSRAFRTLQVDLQGTEQRIAIARRDYNQAVREKNSALRQFPGVVVAKLIGLQRSEPFRAAPGAENVPDVAF